MDKRYRVTEFARLTRVTVRALHYYDQIGLLKPSGRTASRYRYYTDKDLFRLQQIVTLKFLGLSLDQIGKALARPRKEIIRSMRHMKLAAIIALPEIQAFTPPELIARRP